MGDLEEKFFSELEKDSLRKARSNYWYQVLNYMRPFAIKHLNPPSIFHSAMFRHNFLVSYRNLLKNKGFSFINIGGLAMGMAVAIMISLWVYDELTFNQYHNNYDRIGKVMRSGTVNGETFTFEYLPYSLGSELKNSYGSNFKKVLKALPVQTNILSLEDKNLSKDGFFIESGGVELLSLKLSEDSKTELQDPSSVFISHSTAKALFGPENPINQLIKINNLLDVKVAGIYEDIPKNSQFYGLDFLGSFELVANAQGWNDDLGFTVNFLNIYVELVEEADFKIVSDNIKNTIFDHIQSNPEYVEVKPQVSVYPMSRWHLYSEWENGQSVGGRIQFVWFFGLIGIFVLVLACINFMNLSTARSEKRAKEVAVRKSLGSFRSQLIGQFLSESILVSLMAFFLALMLVNLSLPWFNEISGKAMSLFWNQSTFWVIGLGFTLITAFLAGSYPAFYLSSFSPVKVLRGTFRTGKWAALPRKIMVITQFAVSVALISGTIIVYQQIQFAKNRPVGYSKDGLVTILMKSPEFNSKFDAIKNELTQSGAILEMAKSSNPLTAIWSSDGGFNWRGKDPALKTDFGTIMVSDGYGKTVDWRFIEGRDFSKDFASDSTGIVINQTVADILGFDNPVGEIISWKSSWHKGGDFRILGVVEDMILESPFDPVQPAIFFLGGEEYMSWTLIKVHPQKPMGEALVTMEEILNEIVPAEPFDYSFADQTYAAKFEAEERIGKVAGIFASLAILISCLGLFGLASFVAEQRTKEIGIRKVLGASVGNLWQMLSRNFVILVFLSCLIATPITWYLLEEWLSGYVYRVDIGIDVFLIATIGAIGITLLTVSYQAIKAATSDPVKSLRSE